MKILVLDTCTFTSGDICLDELNGLGNVLYFDVLDEDKIIDVAADADAILCNRSKITKKVIDKCKKLKYIGLFATGYNNVDIKTASEKNITVCNVPGYSTAAVAQHTFALLLALSNNIISYNIFVHEKKWKYSSSETYFPFVLNELQGKTLGILGFGAIGKKVAQIASSFDMNIIINTRTAPKTDLFEFVSKKELFKRCDFLSLHCPLTEETAMTVCKETLNLMKPTSYIINTSRGGLINEPELAHALNKGIISGAALDVTTVEPIEHDSVLLDAKNLILSPHISWATFETRCRLISLVAKNFKAFINKKTINKVN